MLFLKVDQFLVRVNIVFPGLALAESFKALEFLKLAAERYNDGQSANDAAWLIFSNAVFFDIDEALRLGKLAVKSGNPNVQATAHNNIGVYYHYSDYPNHLEMAREHFHKSTELFSAQDSKTF